MLKGKASVFGGPSDTGMTLTEGLSIYEHHEADLRPDLFYVRSENPSIGTSKRLKDRAFYFAYRYPLEPKIERTKLQNTQFLFRNPLNQKFCVASLCDWGPHERTGRVFDVSPGVADALGISTDQEIEGFDLSEFESWIS